MEILLAQKLRTPPEYLYRYDDRVTAAVAIATARMAELDQEARESREARAQSASNPLPLLQARATYGAAAFRASYSMYGVGGGVMRVPCSASVENSFLRGRPSSGQLRPRDHDGQQGTKTPPASERDYNFRSKAAISEMQRWSETLRRRSRAQRYRALDDAFSASIRRSAERRAMLSVDRQERAERTEAAARFRQSLRDRYGQFREFAPFRGSVKANRSSRAGAAQVAQVPRDGLTRRRHNPSAEHALGTAAGDLLRTAAPIRRRCAATGISRIRDFKAVDAGNQAEELLREMASVTGWSSPFKVARGAAGRIMRHEPIRPFLDSAYFARKLERV
jgi:hypothetical protein